MSNDKIKLEFGRQSEDERLEATDAAGDSNISNSTKAEPRRRASRAGTRSVATLTDAQLARKRANDREAQRSIRQRTKDRIERLELRIKELTEGQNDERSFEEVQRRNEELEEELRQIREGLPQHEDNLPYSNRSLKPDHVSPGIIQMPPRPAHQVPWSLTNVSPGATGLSTSYPTPGFNSVFSGSNYSHSNAGSPLSEMGSASDYFGNFDVEPPQISAPNISPSIGRNRPGMGRPGIARSVSYPDTSSSSQTQAWSPSPFGFMGIDENLASCNSVTSSMQNVRTRRLSSIPPSRPSSASITSMPGSFTKSSSRADSISSKHSIANSFSHSRHSSLSSSPALSLATPTPTMADGPQAIHQLPMSLPPNSPQISLQIPHQVSTDNSTSSPMQVSKPDNRSPTVSSPLSSSLPQLNCSFVNQPSLHPWELPLSFLPPTGPVDALLIGILQRQRSVALSGTTGENLTGPPNPSPQALIHPTNSNEVHPVSSVLCSLLQRTALRGVPEKVAALFVIYRFMQWQISPTLESYNNLPEWYRPRSSQFVTPHPVWASKIIWGKLRDVVIFNQGVYATEEFQHVYSANLNVNWPYREQDIVMMVDGEMRLSEGFEEHILLQGNWSLDDGFFRRYPELRGACRLTGSMDICE